VVFLTGGNFNLERKLNKMFYKAIKRFLDLLTFADFRKPKRSGIFKYLNEHAIDNEEVLNTALRVITELNLIWSVHNYSKLKKRSKKTPL
jgi:hypothetical protein